MNTNLNELLLQVLANQKVLPESSHNSIVIAQMIITVVTPLILAAIVWLQKQAAVVQKQSAVLIEKIDTNVNSERTKMIERLEAITGAFSDVSKELAVMKSAEAAASVIANNKEQLAQAVEEFRKQEKQ